MAYAHEREHYRVAYPVALRPKLVVHGVSFDVVNISERGIRFRLGNAQHPEPGLEVQGEIRFKRGENLLVRGSIVWVRQGESAVRLDEAIPLRIVMEEQRFLLDRNRHLGM